MYTMRFDHIHPVLPLTFFVYVSMKEFLLENYPLVEGIKLGNFAIAHLIYLSVMNKTVSEQYTSVC